MKHSLFLITVYVICVWKNSLCQNVPSEKFWHVTDIHVDQNYSRTGDVKALCHEIKSTNKEDNGLFGNFLCDSPQSLVNLTIDAMRSIYPSPDFIVWTGDNLPHSRAPNPNWTVVYKALRNITDLLTDAFPSTPIYPSIGNHDTFPPNILTPGEGEELVYKGYLEKGDWNKIIPKYARRTFSYGGYYSARINDGLRIISLNTILWYEANPYTQNLTDPSYQFKWLENLLKKFARNNIKAYIIGHVPPGYYNRAIPGHKADALFHPQFLSQYLSIMCTYSKVIKGQMFGHLHLDMFQLYSCDTGDFLNSALLASSVTPWHFIDVANLSLPVNPSIRLVEYDANDFTLKDFTQYYLNLTKANGLLLHSTEMAKYERLYSFTEAYGVHDLTTKSLEQVFEKLKSDSDTYQRFFKYMTASKISVDCDKTCIRTQLCSMSATSSNEYNQCMTNYNIGNLSCGV